MMFIFVLGGFGGLKKGTSKMKGWKRNTYKFHVIRGVLSRDTL